MPTTGGRFLKARGRETRASSGATILRERIARLRHTRVLPDQTLGTLAPVPLTFDYPARSSAVLMGTAFGLQAHEGGRRAFGVTLHLFRAPPAGARNR